MTTQEIFEKYADAYAQPGMGLIEFQLAADELLKAQREACANIYSTKKVEETQLGLHSTESMYEAILNAKVSNE